MNILLIGEQQEHLSRLKDLLELTFPNALVASGHLESSYKYILDYYEKWSLIIFMPILEEKKVESRDLVYICKSLSLPVLCIVNRERTSDYIEMVRIGVKGIVGFDAPLDILLNGIRFINEGGMYFDPKITKNFDLLEQLNKEPKMEPPALTSQQWEIFKMFASGMSNEEISQGTSIELSTVIEENRKIINLTDSKTKAGAAAKGFFHGWITKK